MRRFVTSALLLTAALAAAATPAGAAAQASGSALGDLPPLFVETGTQAGADYYLSGENATVFFGRDSLRMSLAGRGITDRRYTLGLDFVGARPGARPAGRGRTAATVSHLHGDRSQWRAGLPTYSQLIYRDLWPGIDLVYSSSGGRLKYSFVVRPGADPSAIRLAWQGAVGSKVGDDGGLEVSTPAGAVREDAPYSYQTVGGRRVEVDSSYALDPGHRYGFRVGAHDETRPLVIDPATLVYAGFLGGSATEDANNVVLDAARNLYLVGNTASANFPVTPGSFDGTFAAGPTDAFVAKVNPAGTGLVYATYIGGAGEETGIDIDVDAAGAAYISGSTTSGTGFPATAGPDLTYNGGPQDAYVAKLRPDGAALAYAGFIGGSAVSVGPPGSPNEQANGIKVDAAGRAHVAGFTVSADDTFPDGTDTGGNGDAFDGIAGFDQTFNSIAPGIPDAFVATVSADGGELEYGSYVGGGAADAGTGLTADPAGNVYVNIFTGSNAAAPSMMNPFGGFPATPGSFDTTYNGPPGPPPGDSAVVKLNTAVSGAGSLVYGTFIGGEGTDQAFTSALDGAGNLYVTGRTGSDASSFPGGSGFGSIPGFDRTFNGGTNPEDAFVVKLNAAGSALAYATYVGGAGDDDAVGIAVDSIGAAHISGTTSSTQASFPVREGPDSTYNGGESDAFTARLNPAGTGLDYAGYLGGGGDEEGIGVAVDSSRNAYVSGSTEGLGFPTRVGPDTSFNGPAEGDDAFVAMIALTPGAGHPDPIRFLRTPFAGCPASTANVIFGTAASNSIAGTVRADRIFAGAGNDTVDGLAAADCIDLGSGTDRGQGGSGNDLIVGGLGRDRLSGNTGNDRLRGGFSGDRLIGGFGDDRLSGESAGDRVNGERGRDRISGGSSGDVISAGSSSDRVAGGSGNDRINGNSGNDRLSGNSGRDRIRGSSGRDRISGGSGNDRISARDNQRDRINCGSGRGDRVVADRIDRVASNCERVSRR